MKKSKVFVVGLIALMLVGGLVLVNCTSDCNESVVGASCKLSWTNSSRDSGSMLCGTKSCNVNKNWNKVGTSASCNC
jgi:hypothetical protein